MSSSTGMRVDDRRLQDPRPQVLASMTDSRFLAVLAGADEPRSRAEIAQLSGLSKPAISASASRMLDRGVVIEAGVREGRRGGVATLLRLNPAHGHSIAIAVQTDAVSVRVRDLAGSVHGEWRRDLAAASTADLVDAANELIAESDPGTTRLAAAVSMAHAVDSTTGRPAELTRSVAPTIVFDAATALRLGRGVRLEVDNDVNWATRAEVEEGLLVGCRDFVYVYCGAGLGAGLYLNGQLFRGRRGLAGEIGYLREGSAPGLDLTERLAALGLGSGERYGLDLGGAGAMFDGLPLRADAVRIAEEVAVSIANLAVTLNPEAVALGGPLAAYAAFVDHVAARVSELTIDPPTVVRSSSTPLDGASNTAHAMALERSGVPVADPGRR